MAKKKLAIKKKPQEMKVMKAPRKSWPKCDHCSNASVMSRRRPDGTRERFCAKDWLNKVELSPEFKKRLAAFKEEQKTWKTHTPKKKVAKKVIRKRVVKK